MMNAAREIDWRIHRATYQTTALATLGGSPEWDAALKEYVKRRVLANADMEFGASQKSEERRFYARSALEKKYGKNYRHVPEAASEVAELDAWIDADEEAGYDNFTIPLFRAAHALAKVPAPTFEAACFKELMIENEDLRSDFAMDADCMQIVMDDFDRLAA